jgi:hypothetical protein
MNAQMAASGSSASPASSTASTQSFEPIDVTTSNHASATSSVPDVAAAGTSHASPRAAQATVHEIEQKRMQS